MNHATTAATGSFADSFFGEELADRDPELFAAIGRELERQQKQIELIASENIVSKAVLQASGSVLTNKYAEGYPGRRYYGGCEYVDVAENLAIERAQRLFDCSFANVQPHSGAQANGAVMMALLKPGDTIMGLSLAAGGHLTHGAPPAQSGKWFNAVQYGVRRQDALIDYDDVERLARESKPKLIIAGGSAYPRILDFKRFRVIADAVGAYLMVDMAHIAGLVAGGVHPSPVPHAHAVTTTTHKSLRGPRGGMVLSNEPGLYEYIDKGCPMVLGGPLANVMAAKAVAFAEARRPEFAQYARQVVDNAAALAEGIAAGGGRIVTGGTENHLVLVDVTPFGITGRQAESALEDAGVIVNRNSIPYDANGPWYTSGVRLGTPALTTLGMGTAEMAEVADIICSVLRDIEPVTTRSGTRSKAHYVLGDPVREASRARAGELLAEHPLYPEIDL